MNFWISQQKELFKSYICLEGTGIAQQYRAGLEAGQSGI
jgi:hypothetical protein